MNSHCRQAVVTGVSIDVVVINTVIIVIIINMSSRIVTIIIIIIVTIIIITPIVIISSSGVTVTDWGWVEGGWVGEESRKINEYVHDNDYYYFNLCITCVSGTVLVGAPV